MDIYIDGFMRVVIDKSSYVSMAAGWWINCLIPNEEGSNTIGELHAWIYGIIY